MTKDETGLPTVVSIGDTTCYATYQYHDYSNLDFRLMDAPVAEDFDMTGLIVKMTVGVAGWEGVCTSLAVAVLVTGERHGRIEYGAG